METFPMFCWIIVLIMVVSVIVLVFASGKGKNCPDNCSGRGNCSRKTGKCDCNPGFEGDACQNKTCPSNCSGHGKCDVTLGACKCDQGFTGSDCSTQLPNKSQQSSSALFTDQIDWVSTQKAWWKDIKGLAEISCPEIGTENFDPDSLWRAAAPVFSSNPPYSSFDTETIVNNYKTVCKVNTRSFYQENQNTQKTKPRNVNEFPVYNLPYPPF